MLTSLLATQSRPTATWMPTPARSFPAANRSAWTAGSPRTSFADPSTRSSTQTRAYVSAIPGAVNDSRKSPMRAPIDVARTRAFISVRCREPHPADTCDQVGGQEPADGRVGLESLEHTDLERRLGSEVDLIHLRRRYATETRVPDSAKRGPKREADTRSASGEASTQRALDIWRYGTVRGIRGE